MMSTSLTHPGGTLRVTDSARDGPRAYWNPYAVGVLLGLVLLATYVIAGRGLGATAGFSAVAAWLTGLVSADR
jgi:hypothetical protein